ncbi:hypothetical protein CH254_27635 [Rhodococcus sp. 06-412-2C]|nr:hypothetical protein CH254_27635 [Rhodococcus sp. 06-412-2C]OZC95008.1 hypothetical protein CH279_16990 [Rhodococcus sp. 06-412-2B]
MDAIPRPIASSAPRDFFLVGGRRDAAALAGPLPRDDALARVVAGLRGAVGFFGVVTVRAVRPVPDLRAVPDAREDPDPLDPALAVEVLVFPAMHPG